MAYDPQYRPNPQHWVTRSRLFRAYDGDVAVAQVVENFDCVSVKSGVMLTGTSPSGKTWSRLKPSEHLVFSMRSGHLRVYSIRHRTRTAPRRVWDVTSHMARDGVHLLTFAVTTGQSFQDVVVQVVQAMSARVNPAATAPPEGLSTAGVLAHIAYPLIQGRRDAFDASPVGLSAVLRAATAEQATAALLGKRGVRKDSVKAVANAPVSRLNVIRAVRGLVLVDWAVEFLRQPDRPRNGRWFARWNQGVTESPRALRALFAATPPHRRRALLLSLEDNAVSVADTIRMVSAAGLQLEGLDFRTWRGVHDGLVDKLNRARYANVPIPPSRFSQAVHGVSVPTPTGTLRLSAPADTDEVRGWGVRLSHCIGSYADAAVSGDTLLVGVHQGDTLYATAEVSPRDGSVVQLYGRFNTRLPEAEDLAVRQALTAAFPQPLPVAA